MRNFSLTAVATLALVFGVAACGGDDDGTNGDVRAELVGELGLTDDQASCVIDAMGDRSSVILDVANADFEPSADDLVALDRAGDECDLE